MTLVQQIFFCGLLGLGSFWNQTGEANSCHVIETVCSVDSGYKEDIQGIRESLENGLQSLQDISTTLKVIAQNLETTATESTPTDPASRNCSCNTAGRWTKVANLDMTDPSQQCPDGFNVWNRNTAPLRICNGTYGRRGCESTTFSVHGIEYSHVCGRVKGYQFGATVSFHGYTLNTSLTIDDPYVDGVSLTHGQSPRQHIWTFASAYRDYYPAYSTYSYITADFCPCAVPNNTKYYNTIPPYIGNDYFCETGDHPFSIPWRLLADDPLWDGQGCGGSSTCCSFNTPPFFCKQLPQPTTDDIELRMCSSQFASSFAQTPLEIVEIYIK